MTFVVNGTSGITFPDTTTQSTAANPMSILRETTFTTSGTWTKGANTKYILVEAVGGGAGGRTGGPYFSAQGGGAGGYVRKLIDVSSISSLSLTIGAGGATDSAGGDTSIATYFTATGAPNNSGGTPTGGDINVKGGSGGNSSNALSAASGTGGASFFGGGGPAGAGNSAGSNGQAYGSGGGGGSSSGGSTYAGGTGANGVIIITEFA